MVAGNLLQPKFINPLPLEKHTPMKEVLQGFLWTIPAMKLQLECLDQQYVLAKGN